MAFLTLLATAVVVADDTVPRATRATGPIRVDGILDESAWQDALELTVDYEWSPGDNTPAAVRTDVRLTFDETRLYVAFHAFDPRPGDIRAYFADRDAAFNDDTVGFMLDPFFDGRRAFQFRVNPLGAQMEAINSDVDNSEDWSWDIIWDAAGRFTSDGYVVEIAVPFSQLRFPRTNQVQTWGFLAMRDYPRSSRHRLRTKPIERTKSCLVCQLDPVTGFEGMESGRNVELTPTVTATRNDARDDFPDGPLQSRSVDTQLGASVRWGITPDVTINAALNPDFSQVEADAAELNVNERFAIFYPEKRPFFLEGADLFSTPIDLVFTRTIADPSSGLKVTGKRGTAAFGAFAAEDEVNNLIFPGFEGSSQTSIDQRVHSLVGRYRKDIGRSNVGFLYTGRVADGYFNHVAGLDTYYRLTESDTIRAQAATSLTEYPDALASEQGQPHGSFSGVSTELHYTHQQPDWNWFVDASHYDDRFRADGGFVTRTGFREVSVGGERIWRGKKGGWYDLLDLFGKAEITRQIDGEADEWTVFIQSIYEGPLQSSVWFAVSPRREYYDGVHYELNWWRFSIDMRPTAALRVVLRPLGGDTIDFTNSRKATFLRVVAILEANVGRRFGSSFRYTHETDHVASGHLFTARILETHLLYHINLRTFVRAIVQWRDVEREVDNYIVEVKPKSESIFTQLLFSYKLNPQSVVFVGYSDNYQGDERVDLTQRDRTFFTKVGYTWSF